MTHCRPAYLLLCHENVDYVRELLGYIYSPDCYYIIHCDAKSPPVLKSYVAMLALTYDNVYSLDSRLCSWGGYSLVQVVIDGMHEFAHRAPNCSHLILLSEHHIPLCGANDLFRQLQSGVTLLPIHRVSEMAAASQADVQRRFSMHFRELPGVGVFACCPTSRYALLSDLLFHGSQWGIFSCDAVDYLQRAILKTQLQQHFETSALPDETMIPTLLGMEPASTTLKREAKNATFFAWPHLGGSAGMEFSDQTFATALEGAHLFIRKRPAHLSLHVRRKLTEITGGFNPTFEQAYDYEVEHFVEQERRLLAETEVVIQSIKEAFPQQLFEIWSDLPVTFSPRLYLRCRLNKSGPDASLSIVSENLVDYKIVVSLNLGSSSEAYSVASKPKLTSVIRARVHGLAYNHELIFEDDPTSGFVVRQLGGDFEGLVSAIRATLERVSVIDIRSVM